MPRAKSLSRLGALVLLVAGGLAVAAPESSTASVGSCPASAPAPSFEGWQFSPNATNSADEVQDVRAVVVLRRNGSTCGWNSGFVDSIGNWIAIEPTSASHIAQIGYVGDRLGAGGAMEWCRVWAIGTGSVHKWDCADGTGTAIAMVVGIDANGYDNIDECDSSYGRCTVESNSQYDPGKHFAMASGEAADPCTSVLMGMAGSGAQIGNAEAPLQTFDALSPTWADRPWEPAILGPSCPQYQESDYHNILVNSWDTRN